MKDVDKTKEQLINELAEVRQKSAELEASEEKQKKTEEQLQSLQTLLDTIPNPVFYKDAEGKYTGCNKAFEDFIGLPAEQIIGKTVYDMGLKEIADKYYEKDRELFENPGRQCYECKVKRRDGELRGVIFEKATITDVNGEVEGLIGVISDITECERTEEELRKLSRAVEQSPATVIITDSEGTIEYVNPKFVQLTGYTIEQAIGKNPRILKTGRQPPEFYRKLWETITRGQEWRGEFHNRKKNGDFYWESASISPIRNQEGVITHFVCVKEDITERKLAEESLRQSEQRYRDLYENAPNAYFSVSARDGSVQRCNRAALELLGYDNKETILRMYIWDLYADTPHGKSKAREIFKHFQAGKSIRDVELQMKHKNGQPVWISLTVEPLRDHDGKVIESRSMVINISERKRAEEALQRAHGELEKKVEGRTAELKQEIKERMQAERLLQESEQQLRHLSSQLLSAQESERKSVAQELHDSIGQTLAAIKFGTEKALEQLGKRGSAKVRQPLEAVISMIQNGVNEVRRIQMDLRPPTLDDLGILATISWFCREFQTIYSEIRIEKQIDIREDDVPDSLKIIIYRVLQEALNNIAKHSKAVLVRLSLRKKNGAIDFAIEDNGLGFNLEEALSVESTKRGLGIASMKERTELSGGSFSVDSIRGKGTAIRASWAGLKN